MQLNSFGHNLKVAVIGATGGIGDAFVNYFEQSDAVGQILAVSRQKYESLSDKINAIACDLENDEALEKLEIDIKAYAPFDIVIVASGFLHDGEYGPEKNMRALSVSGLAKNFAINAIAPALIAKAFVPNMREDKKSVFAALSARVGSISDNRLGGWYGYRASKAALNMILKTLSIETGRRSPNPIIIGLHPGTVDTGLSKPFQGNVPDGKLFTAQDSVTALLKVVDEVTPDRSGEIIAWDGKTIPY